MKNVSRIYFLFIPGIFRRVCDKITPLQFNAQLPITRAKVFRRAAACRASKIFVTRYATRGQAYGPNDVIA